MNKRLDLLKSEIGLNSDDFVDDTKMIINKVNTALNADLEERKNYMKQKFIKTALIAVTIGLIGTSTVLAATNSNFLKTFFEGDTSYLEEYVQTPNKSVTDEKFTLTLENVLTTKYQCFVVYSVEALTAESQAELNAKDEFGYDTFIDMDTISFGPVIWDDVTTFSGFDQKEVKERRTDNKRFFAITCVDMVNENEEDFYIALNRMTNPEKIIIPMKSNIETTELVLVDQNNKDYVIQINSLGMVLERAVESFESFYITGVYFRMADDKIKTFSQLLEFKSGESNLDEENYRFRTKALFREVMALSEFKSIIIDGVEYDINDTSKTKPFTPEKNIQPFEIKPYYKEHLWMPLREMCENIGAEIEWNNETNSATVKYRDSVYVITNESTVIIKDGEKIDIYDELNDQKTFIDESGRLIVSGRILNYMRIEVEFVNQIDENGNDTDIRDLIWLLIP